MRYVAAVAALGLLLAVTGTAGATTTRTPGLLEDFEGGSGLTWFYTNNPDTDDGWHDGGFGMVGTPSEHDTSSDTLTPLQIVQDPDDSSNQVLAWTFDGSDPPTEGYSYFDVFLQMDVPEDWSAITGVKFDAKVVSTGTHTGDRDYARLYTRLDIKGTEEDLFNDEDRVWQANKLDVGKNRGWATFELNFDNVTDTGPAGAGYVDPDNYDIENAYANSIIQRDQLESFRFSTYLKNDRWIGSDETMTIYFDNIELVPEPVTMAGLVLGIGALGGYIRRRKV